LLGELRAGVETPLDGFLGELRQNDIVPADALRIELAADFLPHQALALAVEFDPSAVALIDEHRFQTWPVAQFHMQFAPRLLLIRAEQDHAGGIEPSQRARAGERQEWIILHLLFAELLGVMRQDDAGLWRYHVAQCLHAALQKEQHGPVVVLAFALGAAIKQVADRVDADDVGRCIGESAADARILMS